MHMFSDSYIGFDVQREATLVIDDASKAQEVDSDDDISEPDEDSIAGQMAALKGQATADPASAGKKKIERKPGRELRKRLEAKKKSKVGRGEDSESDYESGTDDEEDAQSTSATDTETDSDEEEKKRKAKKSAWW